MGASDVKRLAIRHFPDRGMYEIATAVMTDFKGRTFENDDAALAAVRADRRVVAKLADIAAARESSRREAEERAANERAVRAARAESPRVHTFDFVRGGIGVTEYDIRSGKWQRIPSEPDGKQRPPTDYELIVQIESYAFSFHLHGPAYAGQDPLPGAVMFNGRNPQQAQVPNAVVRAILKYHARPKSWG